MTKERPILFSGAMVAAILDGRKTQTRRAAKPQPMANVNGWDWSWPIPGKNVTPGTRDYWRNDAKNPIEPRYCPYGQPGDRLWVREATYDVERNGYVGPVYVESEEGRHAAAWGWGEADDPDFIEPHELRTRPSIHMPRSACRLVLEVTGVRVERLNDCSEADAAAEGVEPYAIYGGKPASWKGTADMAAARPTAREAYRDLWDSINGAGAWAANPYVWVIEFRRISS